MTEEKTEPKPKKKIVYRKPPYVPTKEDFYVSSAIAAMPFLNLRPNEVAQRAIAIARAVIKYQKEHPQDV